MLSAASLLPTSPLSLPQAREAQAFCDEVNIPLEVNALGPLLCVVQVPAKGQNQYHKSLPTGQEASVSSPFLEMLFLMLSNCVK